MRIVIAVDYHVSIQFVQTTVSYPADIEIYGPGEVEPMAVSSKIPIVYESVSVLL